MEIFENFEEVLSTRDSVAQLNILPAKFPVHGFLYCFQATQRMKTATIRPATAIPAYAGAMVTHLILVHKVLHHYVVFVLLALFKLNTLRMIKLRNLRRLISHYI